MGARTCSDCGWPPAARGPSSPTGVLVDLKNRGVGDVFFLVCDGQGPTGGGANVWQRTVVQTCIVHLIRSTFAAGGPSGRGRR
ncbi:transposase [Saccharothrix sp. S26]|uniref:transposase n=1 Tax=Saccharothrix sp. S26 TaxID=2907215 RepID=UPI0035AB6FC6